ncbi:MAG: hypothetical protein ABWY02_15810 [Telluria sp.]
MILSIVDRPRYGLLEHSEAMVSYMQHYGNEPGLTLYHPSLNTAEDLAVKVPFSVMRLLKRAFRHEFSTLVLWSVGITCMLLPLIRLLHPRAKIIIVCHEPGGLGKRLGKKDDFWYAVTVTLFERLFFPFSHLIVTPNVSNSHTYAMPFAPLLFLEPASRSSEPREFVVYLGRKSHTRSVDLFSGKSCAELLRAAGGCTRFSFFPDGERKSFDDKDWLMRRALCTANLYTVEHNQSGVTPDSLRFGVPIIVSEYDAFAAQIADYKAGIVLPVDAISAETVAAAVTAIRSDFKSYSDGASELFDVYFGKTGFQRYWLPLLCSKPVSYRGWRPQKGWHRKIGA